MSDQYEPEPRPFSPAAPPEPEAPLAAPAPPPAVETAAPAPVAVASGPAREARTVAVAARIVYLVAAVIVTVCVVFIALQQRHQTQLLRKQGCLQQTAYIRALEPSTDSAQQLLAKQTAEVRACVGLKP